MAKMDRGGSTSLIDRVVTEVRKRVASDTADQVVEFVRGYYRNVSQRDITQYSVPDLYGAALSHWNFARQREPRVPKIRVYNPVLEAHGWQSTHTVIEIVSDDMPFLVDSVRMELNRHGLRVLHIIHPVFKPLRNTDGVLLELLPGQKPDEDSAKEAFLHVEILRQTNSRLLEALEQGLRRVLHDVRKAVEDWPKMRQVLQSLLREMEQCPPTVSGEDWEESKALLRWVGDKHFTLLGYRAYDLKREKGEDVLSVVDGSGLGILREKEIGGASRGFAVLPPEIRKSARRPEPLILTKANARATVHRAVNLDYIGVKRFDEQGSVIGEHRFLGLYASAAYSCSAREIPILRRKVEQVLEQAGFDSDSHSGKTLLHILEAYPRDELFQVSAQALFSTAFGILELEQQQRTRLFLRQDPYKRFFVCLVFTPRERYTTEVRKTMETILQKAFNGSSVEFTVRLTADVLARIHFIVRTELDRIPDYDPEEIENQLADATLSWEDLLQSALLEELGEEDGNRLFQEFGNAFPAGYREDFPARTAVHDIQQMRTLGAAEELGMSLYRPLEAGEGNLRFKLFRFGDPIPLSQALPMLENMGVTVGDARPYRIDRRDQPPLWIHDFGLSYVGGETFDAGYIRGTFQDAFAMLWSGGIENDGFNRLVLRSGLNWRDITVLRAYCKYLRQAVLTFSQPYMEAALAANPEVSHKLIALFYARLEPHNRSKALGRASRLSAELEELLDGVSSLDQDRILRSFLAVIAATVRTNYFQTSRQGGPKPYLSFKLDTSLIPDLPRPRPMFEVFVYSPSVEGVHLRGGRVARGGLRWSDRQEDYRTEILGLMKAQMVKNALIVPVGAKGGFVVKRPHSHADRNQLRAEVMRCYRDFIRGLLDVTDNLQEAHVSPPPDLFRYDEDDPYLVVAADKGTATFSDTANETAREYGFWLGDAFASGGQTGYDHKKMGITARSAWESVLQHFRALAIDHRQSSFTVIGIGDMSGDVFGNGMLLSSNIKLIAAFDHRHIFLDPDPDLETSYAERERLFRSTVSSWADYDASLISAGGGVYSRASKSIPLSPQVRKALDVEVEALIPNELIRRLLKAPVDLLWNGGIGTYIKTASERNSDVGDRTNDAVRINGSELRCRIVGEGGNLGLTQLGRIEYARGGGRIDTDFIHNAGGVHCSDLEVNIKILLDKVVADGDMTTKQRNQLLVEMTDEIAQLVLKESYWQTQAISLDEFRAVELLPEHTRFMRHLEHDGKLDRALEHLPDDEQLSERQTAAEGLTRPEIAIMLAYAKITLYEELLDSDLPEDPCLCREYEHYFPSPLRKRFREQTQAHRLRREILCNFVTNRLINRLGTTFVFRLREEFSVSSAEIVRAYSVVWEVFQLGKLWTEIAAHDDKVTADLQSEMMSKAGHLVMRACRWLVRTSRGTLSIADKIRQFAKGTTALSQQLPDLLSPDDREALITVSERYISSGIQPELALKVASMGILYSALDIVTVADSEGVEVTDAARVYFGLGARLELRWLNEQIAALPAQDHWHLRARVAFRDDLSEHQKALTAVVLRQGTAKASALARLETWLAQNHAALRRCQQLCADLKTQPNPDLAMLSVALREVGELTQLG